MPVNSGQGWMTRQIRGARLGAVIEDEHGPDSGRRIQALF